MWVYGDREVDFEVEADFIMQDYSMQGPVVAQLVIITRSEPMLAVLDEVMMTHSGTFEELLALIHLERPELFCLNSGFGTSIECDERMIPIILQEFVVGSEEADSDRRIEAEFDHEFREANGVLCDRAIDINGVSFAPLRTGKIISAVPT